MSKENQLEDILGFTLSVEIEGMKVVIKFEDGKINTNQLQLSPSQANKLMHILNKVLGEF